MMKQKPDWSIPQRQPLVALFSMGLITFWQILKNVWPILAIAIIRGSGDTANRINRFEWLAIGIVALTLVGGLLRYIFFRFYIQNDELIVKKGWLKKETVIIPLDKIQTVNLEQPLLHQALNIVKLTIDTAGSTAAEVSIDSLHKSMAEDLRTTLLNKRQSVAAEEVAAAVPAVAQPILRVSGNDLMRLSISANHLETFFIILAFLLSFYDNVSDISDGWIKSAEGMLPARTVSVMAFFAFATLLITITISTIRICLKYYDLTVYQGEKGFRIKSGLTNVKERIVSARKVQYVSWRSSWARDLFQLKIFQFHLAGDEAVNKALKAELPLTRPEFLEILTRDYHPLPDTEEKASIRIHPSYVFRKFIFLGLLPAIALAGITWYWWGEYSLLFFLYSLLILLFTWLHTRKFRMWAFDDMVYIQKGFFGKGHLMLRWYKIQSVSISQSIHQRKAGLANLTLSTAGGIVGIKYIPLPIARQLMNYALFNIESSREPWM